MKRLISIFMLLVMAIFPAAEQAVTSLDKGAYNVVASSDEQEFLLDDEVQDEDLCDSSTVEDHVVVENTITVADDKNAEEDKKNTVESDASVEKPADSTPILEPAVLSSVTEKTDAKKETNVTVETTQAENVTNTVDEAKKTTQETTQKTTTDSAVTVVKTAAKKTTKKQTYTYKTKKATMYVKASVNVRSLPGKEGKILGSLSKNTAVSVTGVCNETGWYRISYKGKVGYVSNNYLLIKKPVTATTTTAKKTTYTYTTKSATMLVKASVNVRSLPVKTGDKLGSLGKNQEVKVTGVCNETGWYRISYKGKVGYVSNNYLVAKTQAAATVTPKPTAAPTVTPKPTAAPTATPKPTAAPTATPKPTATPTPVPTKAPEKEKYTYTDMKATMYAKASVNVRDLPCTAGNKLGALSGSQEVTVTGQCKETKWYRITYNGKTAYVSNNYLVSTKPSSTGSASGSTTVTNSTFPIKYSDSTCSITITKEWYENAYCYAAHIVFSDYDRFGTACGNGKFGGYETTSHANKRLGALLTVNGDYAAPKLGYRVARSGKVMKDGTTWCEGIYNNNNGILAYRDSLGVGGQTLSTLVANGKATDTFQFGPAFLINGSVQCGNSSERAQRTFIGTNGKAGDIWIVVSDGRKNDGKSAGLTHKQCANYLKSKGCTFGLPLDGGGSSTMVWNGKVLNAAKGKERSVVDFVYFK